MRNNDSTRDVINANREIVRASFDRWRNGECSPIALLAPDAEWTIVGSSPLSKTYHSRQQIARPRLVVFGDGDGVKVVTQKSSVRFLLVSGQPLREPIARYGPFVMNTEQEIEETLLDLRQGTFVTT